MPPPRSGRRAAETTHRLYVCTTCVRDLRLTPGEASRGQRLADELEQRLAGGLPGSAAGPRLRFLKVPCLNGCLRPCNVALRAPGKYNLRFSRLEPADAAAVLDLPDREHGPPIVRRLDLHLPARRPCNPPSRRVHGSGNGNG